MIKEASKILSEDTALLRRVQIYYLCHKFSGQKLKDIGLHFGIGVSEEGSNLRLNVVIYLM